ncbi:response regulator transcription factor [Micrococcales bacterium 31B]|nr:response regulator transcription factor [Micrococcales bacterium 31B]
MRVLVVDDEVKLAHFLRDGLQLEGHQADVAHTGDDALWLADENTYDVIILDVMLPGTHGYAVCRALRERENWTPIVMLTARASATDAVRGLDYGADDYVTKPFDFEVLLARLRSLARRPQSARPISITVAGIVLDPARRTVTRGGQVLEISRREFAVLEILMRNRDIVVSKQDLITGVWGFDFDGDPNIIEVYVGRLRRKVDKPFGVESIETVRGIGYRLRSS